jgi:hypothetical protein
VEEKRPEKGNGWRILGRSFARVVEISADLAGARNPAQILVVGAKLFAA